MAELINQQDTLNQGRIKLNTAIQDAEAAKKEVTKAIGFAEQATTTAKQAVEQATSISKQAVDHANSIQEQFNKVIIEGDSSVEAAQARVDEVGAPHETLKDRIDSGFAGVKQQLVDMALNAKLFGAKGNGTSDDSAAVSAMLTAARGQRAFLPAGTYIVSNVSFPPEFDLVLDQKATLKLKDGSTASAMLNLGEIKHGRITGGTIDGNMYNITNRIHTIVGSLPSGSHLTIEHVHFTRISDHGTYITNFGGYLGFNYNLITDQGEHRGTNDTSTCIVSIMSGQLGRKGLLRFNHNRAYFTKTPRTDGSNPGGVFFAPTTEYATGTGNFSTFEAIGNYFYGYGQHLANNDIAPLHTYPSSEGGRFIGNYFEKCGFCAIAAKSVKDFICTDNYILDGMVSSKNSATEGAISYAPGYHAGSVQRPRAVIANNIVTSPGGEVGKKQHGIAVLAVPGSKATDVIIRGNILTDCGVGISANYTENVKVIDNIVNGAEGGTAGSEMGMRFDNISGTVEIRGNTIISKNGHGIYCVTESSNAVFLVGSNTFTHSGSTSYACILRGVKAAKFSGNVFRALAGYALNLAAAGEVKIGHFIWDNSNLIEGSEVITWAHIEKASGELHGSVSPVGIVTPFAGTKYTHTGTGQEWIASGTTAADWQQVQTGNGGSAGTKPTITVGTAAPGPGGSASISGTDTEGQITVNVGASPGASGGGVATVQFQVPLPAAPKGVILAPANGNALVKNDDVVVYNTTLTKNGFTITAVGTLNANSSYVWYYKVLV